MKKLVIFIGFISMFCCGDLFNTEKHEIIYAFVDSKTISEEDKAFTVKVIKNRLNKYIKNVEVHLNSKNEIVIILNSGFDIEGVNKVVENHGKLDFWPCIDKDKMVSFILEADRINANDSIIKPLSSLVQGMFHNGVPMFNVKDTLKVRRLISNPKMNDLYFEDYKDLKFLFEMPNDDFVGIYGYINTPSGRAPINELHILEVRQDYDQIGRPAISVKMNDFGSHTWHKMTNNAFLNQTKIALAINDVVYSAPMVSSGPISGGNSQISGDFTLEEAKIFAAILNGRGRIPMLKFTKINKIEK